MNKMIEILYTEIANAINKLREQYDDKTLAAMVANAIEQATLNFIDERNKRYKLLDTHS